MVIEILLINSPVLLYSNLAPRLRGIKQKKLIIHPSSSMRFLLFYSPKPRSQVRILIYRNWAILATKTGDKHRSDEPLNL